MSTFRHPCASIEEAVILCGLLNANGVEAALDNYFHAQNDWFLVHALSGVGVVFPRERMTEVQVIIDYAQQTAERHLQSHFGKLDHTPLKRRRLKAWSMPFVFFGIPHLILLILLNVALQIFGNDIGDETQPKDTWQSYINENWTTVKREEDCGYYGCRVEEIPIRPPPPPMPPLPPTHYAVGRSHTIPDLFGLFAYIVLANAFANFERKEGRPNDTSR